MEAEITDDGDGDDNVEEKLVSHVLFLIRLFLTKHASCEKAES